MQLFAGAGQHIVRDNGCHVLSRGAPNMHARLRTFSLLKASAIYQVFGFTLAQPRRIPCHSKLQVRGSYVYPGEPCQAMCAALIG